MSVRILTDEEIQEYLDGSLDYRRQMEVERAVAASGHNRRLLESYRALYGRLLDDEVFDCKPNPNTAPLDQLVVTHHRRSLYSVLTGITVVVMATAAVLALVHVIHWQSVWDYLVSTAATYGNVSLAGASDRVLTSVWQAGADRVGAFVFLSVAGTILLMISWLDKLFLGTRFRRLAQATVWRGR